MTKTDLLEMFKYSKFKVHFINERVPDCGTSTVYRCGSLIDFCRGPHVRHTGVVKAFSVLRVSLSPSLLAFCEGTNVFLRTHPHIGSEIVTTSPSSESPVLLSRTTSCFKNTRHFLRRLQSGIIGKSAQTRNFSCLMKFRPALVSFYHMEHASTMPCWIFSNQNISSEAMTKLSRQTSINPTFGKPLDIGIIMSKTCSHLKLRKRNMG